jgi:hypothetical protein
MRQSSLINIFHEVKYSFCEGNIRKAATVKAFKNISSFFLKIEMLAFILRPEGWQSGRLRRS